jgi:hypothetical protein
LVRPASRVSGQLTYHHAHMPHHLACGGICSHALAIPRRQPWWMSSSKGEAKQGGQTGQERLDNRWRCGAGNGGQKNRRSKSPPTGSLAWLRAG